MTTNTQTTTTAAVETPWKVWQDWTSLVLGAFLAISVAWTGAPGGWFITLGLLTVVAALWALGTASSKPSEWTLVILGFLVFLAPWFAGAATGAIGWHAWIVGVAIVALAASRLAKNS